MDPQSESGVLKPSGVGGGRAWTHAAAAAAAAVASDKHSWDLFDLEAFGQTVLLERETGLDDAAIDNGVGLLVEERKNLVGVLSVEALALVGEMHFFGAE